MNKAVVLVSGGMDSLVLAGIATQENDELYFLHFNYHQRTQERELTSFLKICDYYKPKDYKIIDIDFIKEFGGNSLTDTSLPIFPSMEGAEGGVAPNTKRRIPHTYVPYRNGIFISIACGWAEVLQASRIYIGAVEVDGSGYPDCREVFFSSLETAINNGTKDDFSVKIHRPLINLTKAELVKLGAEMKTPFELSWSCYQENEIACGKCDSCILRRRAFQAVGVQDATQYYSTNFIDK